MRKTFASEVVTGETFGGGGCVIAKGITRDDGTRRHCLAAVKGREGWRDMNGKGMGSSATSPMLFRPVQHSLLWFDRCACSSHLIFFLMSE